MTKTFFADYDPDRKTLTLEEPLEGVKEHLRVKVEIDVCSNTEPAVERPWVALRGVLSREAGEDFARAIDDVFGPING